MKQRIRNLEGYQKAILLAMAAMVLVFSAVYLLTVRRVGYLYQGTILVPTQEDGATVYTGSIRNTAAQFRVTGNQVTFRYGDIQYGPYTMESDPTAVPSQQDAAEGFVGIEIRDKGKILFRGGVRALQDYCFFIHSDGSSDFLSIYEDGVTGVAYNAETGEVYDRMAPTLRDIYTLLTNPPLTHKGEGMAWLAGVVMCIVNAVTLLFADELFYWKMSFLVRNAQGAEPSDWALGQRFIGWAALGILALVVFVLGLQ